MSICFAGSVPVYVIKSPFPWFIGVFYIKSNSTIQSIQFKPFQYQSKSNSTQPNPGQIRNFLFVIFSLKLSSFFFFVGFSPQKSNLTRSAIRDEQSIEGKESY